MADQSSFVERTARQPLSLLEFPAVLLIAVACDVVGLGFAGFAANLCYNFLLNGKFEPFVGWPTIGLLGALIFCLLAGAGFL